MWLFKAHAQSIHENWTNQNKIGVSFLKVAEHLDSYFQYKCSQTTFAYSR